MAITIKLRELSDHEGYPIGRWRLVVTSDEDNVHGPLCKCDDGPDKPGHASAREAHACPRARHRSKVPPFHTAKLPRAPRAPKTPTTTADTGPTGDPKP